MEDAERKCKNECKIEMEYGKRKEKDNGEKREKEEKKKKIKHK